VSVDFLARAIVNRLEDRGLVEFQDAEVGILVVTKVLEENFAEIESEMRRIAAERDTLL
jgi:hypothetical protein